MKWVSTNVVFLLFLFSSSIFYITKSEETSNPTKSLLDSKSSFVKWVEKQVVAALNLFQDYAAKETRQKVKDAYNDCKKEFKRVLNNIKEAAEDVEKKRFEDAETQLEQAISSVKHCSNELKIVSDESSDKVKRRSAQIVVILRKLLKQINNR